MDLEVSEKEEKLITELRKIHWGQVLIIIEKDAPKRIRVERISETIEL